ncbi:thioesterase II family protein [Marinivivus vitaminiproducens]|uniref:thioesterase II family protein n=1 Tax=Marinivivus vitaminiproducens TaxID=3035935 RepID=UPI0027A49A98|nr:alpha/beta fold hydrolase [Geminicoccaceae bacterium SCSIO 64248]
MTTVPVLVCLPPAGAGPAIYRTWTCREGSWAEMFAPSLPGREARIAEAPAASLEALADQLADQLAPLSRRPYALFGYSMGAALAYEIARRWSRDGLPPEMLFVLGANPPGHALDSRNPVHQLESAAFRRELRAIGGTPSEILDDLDIMSFYEPLIRNDFRMSETYRHEPDGRPLPCPAHVFVADEDHIVDAEAAAGWRDFVQGDCVLHSLRGRHMLEQEAFAALQDVVLSLWSACRDAGGQMSSTLCSAGAEVPTRKAST